MNVKGTLTAWLSNPAQLLTLNPEEPLSFLNDLQLTMPSLSMEDVGWVRVGTVAMDCTVDRSHKELMQAGADAIRSAIRQHDAEAEAKRTQLNEALQKFLAIGWQA